LEQVETQKRKFFRKFRKSFPGFHKEIKKREGKKVSVNRKECCDRAGREDLGLPEGRRGRKKKKSEAVSHGKRMNRVAQLW
jgi:hypothetical protein